MIIVQTTARLIRKLPLDASGRLTGSTAAPLPASPLFTTPSALGLWRAEWLEEGNGVLVVHEPTLLPLVLPGRPEHDLQALDWLFLEGLANVLMDAGVHEERRQLVNELLQPLGFVRDRWPKSPCIWSRLIGMAERQLRSRRLAPQTADFSSRHSLQLLDSMVQTGLVALNPLREFGRHLDYCRRTGGLDTGARMVSPGLQRPGSVFLDDHSLASEAFTDLRRKSSRLA